MRGYNQGELDLVISLHPEDSITNIGSVNSNSAASSRRHKSAKSSAGSSLSRSSTASSARLRASAKKAALLVEWGTGQDIQLQELLLTQKKENFELETVLAKAETEEQSPLTP